jgi:hypothetical protein
VVVVEDSGGRYGEMFEEEEGNEKEEKRETKIREKKDKYLSITGSD